MEDCFCKRRNPIVEEIPPLNPLPFPAKLFEKLVVGSLKDDFLNHFGSQKFGYKPKSSTLSALASLHKRFTRYLGDPNISGAVVIAYNFSKVFERLSGEL